MNNKKIKAIALCLVSFAFITACSDVSVTLKDGDKQIAVIKNEGNDFDTKTFNDLFETIKTQQGGTTAVDYIIKAIALNKNTRSAEYTENRAMVKLTDESKSSTYFKNGYFDESLFKKAIDDKGYPVTCSDGYGPIYNAANLVIVTRLKCDYSEYLNKVLIPSVHVETMYEDYVIKNFKNEFDNKKPREVEVFTWERKLENDQNFIDDIQAVLTGMTENYTFKTNVLDKNTGLELSKLEDAYKVLLERNIDKEVAIAEKVILKSTDPAAWESYSDKEKAKTYDQTYSGDNSYPIADGVLKAKREIYAAEYNHVAKVYSITDSTLTNLLPTALVQLITDASLASKLRTINGVNYVTSQVANIKTPVYTDSTKNYIVKVTKVYEKEDYEAYIKNTATPEQKKLIEEVARTIATNSTYKNAAIVEYLKEYGITIHDQLVNDYIESVYPKFFEK